MKKGSLNLSMNAIVILILAITLLGLGLSFMRGLFKQMESKVNVAVSSQELVNPPTSDSPVTVAPSSISLRGGEDGSITVAFLNNLHDAVDCELVVCRADMLGSNGCDVGETGYCTPGQNDCSMPVVYSSAELQMTEDQINTWVIAISPDSSAPAETVLFTAKMNCENSDQTVTGTFTKDFIVVIKP